MVSSAALVPFALSPPGTDKAVGIRPQNEVPPSTNSTGSGDEILRGIFFNTDTMTLSFAIGYGSAAGFTDLTGPAIAMHIHGPAPVGSNAPVIFPLLAQHLDALNPTNGGVIFGGIVYSNSTNVAQLFAGLQYVNIHTPLYPAGEIRGQLVAITNQPPMVVCPAAAVVECASPQGDGVTLTAQVSDADGDALQVIWVVGGSARQTNSVPGNSTNAAAVTFTAVFPLGTNEVTVVVSDGVNAPVVCSTHVIVVDTTPPTIEELKALPEVLWPPDHKMVPVTIRIKATDLCGPVRSRIVSVRSNEPIVGRGDRTAPDWQITGALTLNLRAERFGQDDARIYTITVEATDASGNSAAKDVQVLVPHDRGKGK